MKYDLRKKRNWNYLPDREIWNDVIIARMKKVFKEDEERRKKWNSHHSYLK